MQKLLSLLLVFLCVSPLDAGYFLIFPVAPFLLRISALCMEVNLAQDGIPQLSFPIWCILVITQAETIKMNLLR